MAEEKGTEQKEVVEPIVIEHPNLVTALTYAQLGYKPVEKNQKVDFDTKQGGRVKYSYADLASIRAATDPHLNRHGLVVVDRTEMREGRELLVSTLYHAGSDEFHETYLDITLTSGDMKDIAANITYARRYNYCNLTGRIAEEDNDARDVQRRNEKQQSSQADGKKAKTPLETAKANYHSIVTENKIFADNDAKHDWQGKAIAGKPSTTQWNLSDVKKAIDLIQWRLVVGIQSDGLLEYITTKSRATKGLQKQFLALMDVSKLADIKDVSRWNVGMTAAKLSISHKLEIALDMGKVLMRVDGVVFDKFLETVGVEKMIKMDSEQVIGWEVSFRSAVNQYNTENSEAKVDVEKLITGEAFKKGVELGEAAQKD